MQIYKQLDLQGSHQIKALLDAGLSQTKIAEIIGVHKSTTSRELSRNVPTRGRYANEYRPEAAQRKTNNHDSGKRKHIRFTEDLKDTGHPVVDHRITQLGTDQWTLERAGSRWGKS